MNKWIEWQGGPRPVPADAVVEVEFADGDKDMSTAGTYAWGPSCPNFVHIVRYCVLQDGSSAPTAPALLTKAAGIMEERGKQYDKPQGERSMGRTVAAFNLITNREGDRAITESEGWLLMQVLKDVRDRTTKAPHADSLHDGIAYSALKAEARLQE